MATTSIPFWQFAVVSAIGIVYECAVFVYFGSMADSIHAVVSGEGGRPAWFQVRGGRARGRAGGG